MRSPHSNLWPYPRLQPDRRQVGQYAWSDKQHLWLRDDIQSGKYRAVNERLPSRPFASSHACAE